MVALGVGLVHAVQSAPKQLLSLASTPQCPSLMHDVTAYPHPSPLVHCTAVHPPHPSPPPHPTIAAVEHSSKHLTLRAA